MALEPLKRSRQRQGPSLAFHTIGVQGYFGSVQPPFQKFLDPPLSFHWNIGDGVVNRRNRNKWQRSDSSDSDSVELLIPFVTAIFDFY